MSNFVNIAIILDGECTVGNFVVIQGQVEISHIVTIYEDHKNQQQSFILLSTGQAIHVDLQYDDLKKMVNG